MRISARTVEDLERLFNRYFFSTSYKVNLETMKIENPKISPENLARWEVRVKNGRYYIFELLNE